MTRSLRSRRSHWAVLLGLGSLVVLLTSTAGAAPNTANPMGDRSSRVVKRQLPPSLSARLLAPTRRWVPGQVLVTLKAPATTRATARLRSDAGLARSMERLGPRGHKTTYLYSLEPGQTVRKALVALRADPAVLRAQPNYIYHLDATPDDPAFANQWGLHNTGQTIEGQVGTPDADIDAPEAWDIQTGDLSPVTVAVIDSGIDLSHPDLASKIWVNDDAAGGGDGDSNGYVDDTNGWNFAGISQYSANAAWGLGESSSIQQVAQRITGTGRPLTHVGVDLARVGMPATGITVSVRQTLGGTDLASYSVTVTEVGTTRAAVSKALSTPVTLTAGATYYIVIRTSVNSGSDYYLFFDNSTYGAPAPAYKPDPYREGSEYYWDGYSWVDTGTDDLVFTTNANASPRDDNGHGTHVSGIVGAATDNATGIAGASWAATIMPLKAGDCSGSLFTADTIAAIYYAVDNGADVINMSFGSSVADPARQAAITYAHDAGVVLVAASGNSGGTSFEYPASCDGVISVAATDNRDAWAPFSTYNSAVDVSAPGVDVYSTVPTYAVGLTSYGCPQNYAYLDGTSMASPLVAGVAALTLARDSGLTPDEVAQYLQDNADDLGTPGRDDYFGYGRINAAATLIAIPEALSGHFTIGDGSGYTTASEVTIHSNVAAAAEMRVSVNDGATWGAWTAYASTSVVTLAPADGVKHIRIQYRDGTGEVLELLGAIELDTTPPSGTMAIEAGAVTTPSRNVTVDSAVSGAAEMRFSVDDGASWAAWEPYAVAHDLTLTSGDGLKTVHGEYRDRAGNTLALEDSITLTRGPSGTFSINAGAVATHTTAVTCTSAVADATSMRFSTDHGATWTDWESYAASRSITLPSGDGNKQVNAQYRDSVGPVLALEDGIALDTTGPTTTDDAPTGWQADDVTLMFCASDACSAFNAAGFFYTRVDYGTGTTPESVAVGDFNGDGIKDLATGNYNAGSVSVLLGTGAGAFAAKTDYATGSGVFSVTVGDFNGDGIRDLATANRSVNTLSVQLGNGDGSFQTKVDYATGKEPSSVAVGDFNADGRQDLVEVNSTCGSGDSVGVLLGSGDGTFGARTDYHTDTGPRAVAIGDLNGDGKQDLMAANYGSDGTVSVFLGDGDGTFAAKTDYWIIERPCAIAVGDFNADGKLDLAATSECYSKVVVGLGTGTGGFSARFEYGTGATPESVAVGDFNGDGKQDLATANHDANSVSVLLGNGNGTFAAKTDWATGTGSHAVAVSDLDVDGKQDLVVANGGANTVNVLFNNDRLGAGVDHTEYSTDGGATWTSGVSLVVPAPADHSNDGVHEIRYRSVDRVGNLETAHTCHVKIDTLPPTTSDDADDLWHNSDVTVHFDASDAGSGVASTEYSTNAGSTWTTGTSVVVPAPADHSNDGVHAIWYRSTDNLGHLETAHSCQVKIYSSPPTTTDDYDGLWHRDSLTVHLTPHDEGGGVAKTEYRIGEDGEWITGLEFTLHTWRRGGGTGIRDVYYRSWDDSGHAEEPQVCHAKMDGCAPATTDDCDDLVHSTDVTVHLTATDADSGVKRTRYSIDGGVWQVGNQILIEVLDGQNDGVHEIRYYSVDNANNVETREHRCYVTIDATP